MTLNLSESNKNSNYYLTQIDDIRELSVATKTSVDDIQTDVDTIQTDLGTAQGQIAALITAGSAGESQLELDGVIADTTTNTTDITDIKIDITDLQAKTAFIESVTASTTTQTERTTYLNDQGGEIGYIGPQGDELYIACSLAKNLIINPDQGHITHYCENTYFGDNNGPGRLILSNSNGDGGSLTINEEVQNHAYTDADHTRLNDVDSDIAGVQTQINTINTNVSVVSTDNAVMQVQLDLVAADLDTAEIFIAGHTNDIVDLTTLINTNITNIASNDVEIANILTDIDTINTTITNNTNTASNQTQVDAIQVSVDAHTDDIVDLTTLINTNITNIASNDVEIANILTDIGTINTTITNNTNTASNQIQVDVLQVSVDTHTNDITDLQTNTAFIESVTSSSTSQTHRTNYLNSAGAINGYIGPSGDNLMISCSGSKNLVINPDYGYILRILCAA
jgi:trimeric autotransporter adhesin